MSKMHIENLKEIDMSGSIANKEFKIMFYPMDTSPDIIGLNISDGKLKLVKRVSNSWSTIYTWNHS